MYKAPNVERRSLTIQVADALRELIMTGQLRQGAPLRQIEIAEKFGVSRNPVREAFQQLEAEGLITTIPYKGAVVARLSAPEIEEYFNIRATLEAELLRHAIPKMRPANIERARKWLAKTKSAEVTSWGECNWHLHAELYAPAERPIMLEYVKRIHDNLDRYVRLQLSLSQFNRDRAYEEHEELISLCEKRQSSQAEALLRKHIAEARDDLLVQFNDLLS